MWKKMIWLSIILWPHFVTVLNAARLPPSLGGESNETSSLGHLPPMMEPNGGAITNVSAPPDPSHRWLEDYLYVFSRYSTPLTTLLRFQRSIVICRIQLSEDMQAWKMKPSDIYPSKKFDCIEQPPNSFHLILDNYSGWDMTFGLLSQTLQNISREARSFRDGVPPFNFDILRRPTMQLLAQGQWRPLIYPSINQTGTILPNSSISAYPPDPFVAGHGSLVYVFSHYSPPFQSILSLATTAMFCEYVIQAQLDKAHAKITDQYPSKEFYCTDDDILDSISLIYNPNAARWNFTYGNILSTLEDLTIVVAAFDNRLPYFAFEIHAKLDKLRPLVATGNWAKAKPVTGAVSIASETPSKTDRK